MTFKLAWLIWGTSGLLYLFEFAQRVAPSVMVPELITELGVSAATIGTLSACYYYSYAAMQIPVGILLDRFSTKKLLAISSFSLAVSLLIFSTTKQLYLLNLSRMVIGMSSAFSFVGCLKLGSDWFPASKFALIVGLTNLLGAVGAFIGGKPLAIIVDSIGWRQAIAYSTVFGFVLCIAIILIVKDKPPRDKPTSITHSAWFSLVTVISNKQTWIVALYGSLMVVPIAAYAELWGISFLINHYRLSRPIAAEIVSLSFIGIALGGPIIGWYSDRIGSRKQPMLLGVITAISCGALIIHLNNLAIYQLIILHLLFGFATSSMLLSLSMNAENSPEYAKSTAIGFTNGMIMLISSLFQPITGYIIDLTDYNYQFAMLPIIICQMIALLLIFFIKDNRVNSEI